MNPIVKNQYVDVLLKLILLSAIVHIIIISIHSVLNRNISNFNFFKIIEIDLIFPEIVNMSCYGLYSFVVFIWLYILLYYLSSNKNKHH